MNLYVVSSKEKFLEEVANYIIEKFSYNFHNVTVLMPNGLLCLYLQKLIIKKLSITILPKIIPIEDISVGSKEIFGFSVAAITKNSKITEKLILADIIYKYKNFNYSIEQSLNLSTNLANLFTALEASNINIEQIKTIDYLDQTEYWNRVYEFVSYSYCQWKKNTNQIKKSTTIDYKKAMLNAVVKQITAKKDNHIVVAGLYNTDYITNDFLKNILQLDNGHIIFPPFPNIKNLHDQKPEEALFNISSFVAAINVSLDKIKPLGIRNFSVLDKLIINFNNKIEKKQYIYEYIEFDNIFYEAEYIANKCREIIDHNPNIKIALITNTTKAKEYYTMSLIKNNIDYYDLIGNDILKINSISFLMVLANIVCNEFSVKSFFSFISHPLIINEHTSNIKILISKYNRFAQSLKDINYIVNKYQNDDNLRSWFLLLYKNLNIKIHTNNFSNILLIIVNIAEKICPDFWQDDINDKILDLLIEIINNEWPLIIEAKDFSNIFRSLLKNIKIYSHNQPSNIIICSQEDAALINFDYVFLTDCNEGVVPLSITNNWINKNMQKKLSIDWWIKQFGISLYYFYLNLHNTKVIITRAKTYDNKKNILPSLFLLRLQYILADSIIKSINREQFNRPEKIAKNSYVISDTFPDKISATDIEILIRSPYNFYAKKILNLSPIVYPEDNAQLVEFGIFFHNCVSQYSASYQLCKLNKLDCIIQISQNILNNYIFPDNIKKSWLTKFRAIAKDFIFFDELRRKNTVAIYNEIKGEIDVVLDLQPIKIIAIADRIEIGNYGDVTIIDYKTGQIPTKKEILSGLSPQLIIEAIILLNNGFPIKANYNKKIEKLIYVKINSSKPYITTKEVVLSDDELNSYYNSLVNLLNYYSNNRKFHIDTNLTKYDFYQHLARRF